MGCGFGNWTPFLGLKPLFGNVYIMLLEWESALSNGELAMMISAPCVIESQKQFSTDFEIVRPQNKFGKG